MSRISVILLVLVLATFNATAEHPVEAEKDREPQTSLATRGRTSVVMDRKYKGNSSLRGLGNSGYEKDFLGVESRIVGGVDAKRNSYPYFTRVDNRGNAWCGGVLVHPKYVLTAAHCNINGPGLSAKVNAYVGGSNVLDHGSQYRRVVRKIVHPNYKRSTLEYDVMLLELNTPVNDIKPIQINDAFESPTPGKKLMVIGLGQLGETGYNLPDTLQQVKVRAFKTERCNRAASYNGRVKEESMLCAGVGRGGKDSCFGDSGGPILDKRRRLLVGLVSHGSGCARKGYPGIYARASAVRDWVGQVVCPTTNSPACLDEAKTVQEQADKQQEEEHEMETVEIKECTNLASYVYLWDMGFKSASCKGTVAGKPAKYCGKYDLYRQKRVWEVCRNQCPFQSGC